MIDELTIFDGPAELKSPVEIKNHYYWGDNLEALHFLLAQPSISRPKMIYIDPPYMSQAQYHSVIKGSTPDQPDFHRAAFADQWANNIDAYLTMLYPRLQLMQQILQEDGSIFVHVDWHVSHYVRVLLDEIFGRHNFINEIVWCYSGGSNARKHLQRKHDMIYWYARSQSYTFHQQHRPYTQGTLERGLTAVKGPNYSLSKQGAILQDWWTDINKILSPTAYENLKYPTQKPRELLKRLISMASSPGDLVADFFAGSATTAEVCQQLDRRWLLCDNSPLALQTSLGRLIKVNNTPFAIHTASTQTKPDLSAVLEVSPPLLQINGPTDYWLSLKIDYYQPQELPENWNPSQFDSYIEFWEIDPDYDGQLFQSRYQVMRTKKSTGLALNILLSIPRKHEYSIAIKVYDYNANQSLKVIQFKPE